jgi:hypothetical protein
MPIGVEGRADPPPDQMPDVIYRTITPGYFKTMGIQLVQGPRHHSAGPRRGCPRHRHQREDGASFLAGRKSDR